MRGAVWLLALSLCAGAHARAAITLGIHVDEPAPTIAQLLVDRLPQELKPQLRSFTDASELHAALAAGEVDLAFLEDPLEAMPGVSAVSDLYPSVLHLLVRRPMATVDLGQLLTSGPVWAGVPGGIGHGLASRLAVDYAVAPLDLLSDPWSQTPAVYFIFGGLLGTDAVSRLEDYRLVSIGDPGAVAVGSVAQGIALRYPNLRAFVLPAEIYPSLARKPALTLAVKTLLVARSGLEPGLVYELAMETDRIKPAIASVYPLAGIDELGRSGNAARALPWHPGAQRYIDRELPSVIERYAEFVGATVTLTIALVTLSVALYRRRRQARKDRLDEFYQQALAYRAELELPHVDPGLIANKLRALQAEVFELLIAERIDADSALVAFLSLSNQLLEEAGVDRADDRGSGQRGS